MKILRALFVIFVVFSATEGVAALFETDSFPGEGGPNFSAKSDILILRRHPDIDSSQIALKPGKNKKILFDKSKQITKKSITLTAKSEVTDLTCNDTKKFKESTPIIKRGETIEYLQYRAEGYITARYNNQICEVFIMDKIPKFEGIGKEPIVEWWIRVIDEKKKPQGWLLVDKSQVNFLERNF